MSAATAAVSVRTKAGKPVRWVVVAITRERGLCWQIVLGYSDQDARRAAADRLRADHGVDIQTVALASEVGI